MGHQSRWYCTLEGEIGGIMDSLAAAADVKITAEDHCRRSLQRSTAEHSARSDPDPDPSLSKSIMQ
jgi:hypothetical protein